MHYVYLVPALAERLELVLSRTAVVTELRLDSGMARACHSKGTAMDPESTLCEDHSCYAASVFALELLVL